MFRYLIVFRTQIEFGNEVIEYEKQIDSEEDIHYIQSYLSREHGLHEPVIQNIVLLHKD